ncbi:ABC transporter permease [Paraburkholderia antibiotica]|uniref:ABC transporter permease n=1 Tax=Paraburkholderia antibiotica TaxID=2728839 RepID=A0A7X9X6I6_9BURK|nr:ABC transporter permease [Paraburkholderia antibiotica]NML32351.1 ABC transporter permease [Paraburkholderia antibiotica]
MTSTVPSGPAEARAPEPTLDDVSVVYGPPSTASARRSPRRFFPSRTRLTIELRQQMAWHRQVVILALAIAAGLAICVAILAAAGVAPADVYNEFVVETLGDPDNLRAVLVQAAPMAMVGLAAALAFRVRFWNLGLEGQMVWGAIGATAIALAEAGAPATRLWLMGAVALTGGALWSVLPLLLKMRLGINEIISTLLLNYVAGNFLLDLLYGRWKDPHDSFPHSPSFLAHARLPTFAGGYSSAIVLAVLLVIAAWWFLQRSRAGIYIRFVSASVHVADAMGVHVRRIVVGTVLLSGALAGFAGFAIAAGRENRLTQDFYSGYGFSGILIAFLARNNPVAAGIVALVIAALFVAGRSLQVLYQIPFSMVQLIQAILVIVVAASDFFVRYRISALGKAQ